MGSRMECGSTPMKSIIFALCLLPAFIFSAAQKSKTEDPIYPVGKQASRRRGPSSRRSLGILGMRAR